MTTTRTDVAKAGNEGWSLYGAPWSQPVAIHGKSTGRKSGENKPNPLRLVATGCLRRFMVRRGSTVRVRQRALQEARQPAASRLTVMEGSRQSEWLPGRTAQAVDGGGSRVDA